MYINTGVYTMYYVTVLKNGNNMVFIYYNTVTFATPNIEDPESWSCLIMRWVSCAHRTMHCSPVQCHPLAGFDHVATLKCRAPANIWYIWRVISIFMSGTVFWKIPLWKLVPQQEAAPEAVWEGDYSPRALSCWALGPLQEGSPKVQCIAKTYSANPWTFYTFRVIKETVNTWWRPGVGGSQTITISFI